ncbi:MAG: hypothetical protein ACE5MG_07080 [Candidatus Methylomirabilales bacterium]
MATVEPRPPENQEELVLKALGNPKYNWRTCEGVSHETGIDVETVGRIVESMPDLIIRSRIPDEKGRPLYATRKHYKETHGLLDRFLDQFRSA